MENRPDPSVVPFSWPLTNTSAPDTGVPEESTTTTRVHPTKQVATRTSMIRSVIVLFLAPRDTYPDPQRGRLAGDVPGSNWTPAASKSCCLSQDRTGSPS